jgi:hypothetical protein
MNATALVAYLLDPQPPTLTEASVHLPRRGHIWIASLFRSDPKHEMDDDFVRMKSLLELGKTRARDGTRLIYESGSPEANLVEMP